MTNQAKHAMNPIKTQSGRTTRSLLTALLMASRSAKVMVVGISWKDAISLYERALNMTNKAHYMECRSTLSFRIGHGIVRFSAPLTEERMTELQMKNYLIIVDHLTVE